MATGTTAHISFDVTVNANVTNLGPYGTVNADVTLDLDLTGAADCSRVPDTSQSDNDLTLGTDVATATWSVTCTDSFWSSERAVADRCVATPLVPSAPL